MKQVSTTPKAKHTTHAHETAPSNEAPADTPAADTAASAVPTRAAPAPATPAPSVATTSGAFIAPPPADMNIPSPPQGWVAGPGDDFRGTQPKAAELATLAGAIEDLQRFAARYQSTLGSGAPPFAHVLQVFTAGSQWSSSRVATENWDAFASAQEGLAWIGVRRVMDTLRPAFDLAAKSNTTLAVEFPSLTSLLAAQQVIARKGAAARKANKEDQAAGKAPTHGKVGKRRQTAAAKAALKAANDAAEKAASATADAAAPSGQAAPQPTPPGPTTTTH